MAIDPTGFWSYASNDDRSSGGQLSLLRAKLAGELAMLVGNGRVHLFQDVASIPPGADWERQIREALRQSWFFIPIITPSFLSSAWCCKEVKIFQEIKSEMGQDALIFPIQYVDVSLFSGSRRADCFDPTVLDFLREKQWADYSGLRFGSTETEASRRILFSIANAISKTLYEEQRTPAAPTFGATRREVTNRASFPASSGPVNDGQRNLVTETPASFRSGTPERPNVEMGVEVQPPQDNTASPAETIELREPNPISPVGFWSRGRWIFGSAIVLFSVLAATYLLGAIQPAGKADQLVAGDNRQGGPAEQAGKDAEAKQLADAAERAKKEAEAKRQAEAAEQARKEAEAKRLADAAERAKKEAEANQQAEAAEQARKEAEAKRLVEKTRGPSDEQTRQSANAPSSQPQASGQTQQAIGKLARHPDCKIESPTPWSTPEKLRIVKSEPPDEALPYGRKILVDNGQCGVGRILEVTGGYRPVNLGPLTGQSISWSRYYCCRPQNDE